MIREWMRAAQPDFWSVVGQTELDLYESVAAGTLAASAKALTESFTRHHERVASPKMWASVYDNTTFVLAKYMGRATAKEVTAAKALVAAVAKLAGRSDTAPPKRDREPHSKPRRVERRRAAQPSRKTARRATSPRRKGG